MASTRESVVAMARKYVGTVQGSKNHKAFVNDFNSIKPHGEVGNYSCAWCAIFVTVIQKWAGNGADVVPQSYNCGTLITYAKKLGIWVENDNYKPTAGDMVIYYWSAPAGECTHGASHVGIVEKVSGNTVTVIEGNMGSGYVGRRSYNVGYRYVRGYICPRYKSSGSGTLYSGALPTATIRLGSRGENVKHWQTFINWYFGKEKPLAVDGIFGAQTKSWTVKFQSNYKSLIQDGIVGVKTIATAKAARK